MNSPVPKDANSYRKAIEKMGKKFIPLSDLVETKCGSDWNLPELLAFRVLVKSEGTTKFPTYLEDYRKIAHEKLAQCSDMQDAKDQLIEMEWKRSLFRATIGKHNIFNNFFRALTEEVEEPLSVVERRMSQRGLAKTGPFASVNSSQSTHGDGNEEDESADEEDEEEESIEEVDNKDSQPQSDASEYQSSSGTVSAFEENINAKSQKKPEMVVRRVIAHFIETIVFYVDRPTKGPCLLEWMFGDSGFAFSVPRGQ